jgi:hypothetical protein
VVAAAPRRAALWGADPLRRDTPLKPPFEVDPTRLYEVGRDGLPRTDPSTPPPFLSRRHRLALGLSAGAALLLAALAGAAVLALALGWRAGAALAGLAFLAATPLLALGPAQDWWRHRRGRRRAHRVRPPGFGG